MSVTTESRIKCTPEDLLARPDGKDYELVDGELVERNVGALSSLVGAMLTKLIVDACLADDLAWPFNAEMGYRCFVDAPGKIRRPDISCVRRDRLPIEQLDQGYIAVAPDLAVEVVSPNDVAYELDAKVDEYLRAGTRLVWVVNPERRTVLIYRADGTVGLRREADELAGEDVLPGFACRVGELFPAAVAGHGA